MERYLSKITFKKTPTKPTTSRHSKQRHCWHEELTNAEFREKNLNLSKVEASQLPNKVS